MYSGKINPDLGENQGLFGQFVGEWEFEWFCYEPNKETEHEKGEYGTTLRFSNKKRELWNLMWLGPIKTRLNTFEARKICEDGKSWKLVQEMSITRIWHGRTTLENAGIYENLLINEILPSIEKKKVKGYKKLKKIQ